MRNVSILLLLAAMSGSALAQEAAQEGRRVLVIGDQLAGGMGAGLTRMVEESGADVRVFNRFNESSGLARPEIYDWAAAIPKMVEGKNVNAAFVLMGLNDRREIRVGDKVAKFGTTEWNSTYQRRVDAVIDALAAQHIQVFWMGEPPMGDPALDADMQNLTALVKERAAAKGVVFIDLRAPFLSAQGGYSDRGLDEAGNERRLREGDGVTFFKLGNNRLGQIALSALKSSVAASPVPQAVAPTAPQVGTAVPAAPIENNGPIFGQEGMGDINAAAAQGSKALTAAVEQDKVVKAAASASTIGVGAAKGSNAEALFTKGLTAAPPVGRFDDFSLRN